MYTLMIISDGNILQTTTHETLKEAENELQEYVDNRYLISNNTHYSSHILKNVYSKYHGNDWDKEELLKQA